MKPGNRYNNVQGAKSCGMSRQMRGRIRALC